MTKDISFITKTKALIDNLKSVCANYGLGNDGNEFKIITQVFLYKFLNDKFRYAVKQEMPALDKAENFSKALLDLPEDDYQFLLAALDPNIPRLQPEHLISHLFSKQNDGDFAKLFDDTLRQISIQNADVFSVKSFTGAKDILFDELSQFISDSSQRDAFCKALINKLFEFSFEEMFKQKYDFFATIFEYLIKDYNTDSGGKYAEYYTPPCCCQNYGANHGAGTGERSKVLRSKCGIGNFVDESCAPNWGRKLHHLFRRYFSEIE